MLYMEHVATISSKGQITLPARIRKDLHIHPGDRLIVVKKGQTISIKPDTYDEELTALRKKIEKHVKAKGLWGKPIEEIRAQADEARADYYRKKYGVRS